MLTVATILKEPVDITLRFVAWYLNQGADRIILCFDDPEDPAIDILHGMNRVECIRCSPEFWAALGCAPDLRFTKRQNRALGHVYSTLKRGWFLNVDSDELVHLEGRTLAEEIAAQPDTLRALRILPAEHIQTPDSPDAMHFRLPMPRWAQRAVYDDLAKVMYPRQGLMAHTMGKSVSRAGLGPVIMRQHWVETSRGQPVCDRILGAGEGAYLLHHADQGYHNWKRKLPWRLSSRGFRQPFRDVLDPILARPDPETDLQALYRKTHVFHADRLQVLTQAGAVFRLDQRRSVPLPQAEPMAQLRAA